MARRPAPLPSTLGVRFSSVEARAAGTTRTRLGAQDLEAPFAGMRRRRDIKTPRPVEDRYERIRLEHCERARCYLEVAPAGIFFVGRTASAIMKLPARLAENQDLEVAVLAPGRAPRRPGIRARQVDKSLVTIGTYRGFPISSPATTWALLGRELSLEQLVILGDAIVHRSRIPGTQRLDRPPHATVEDLATALAMGVRAGAPVLRRALSLVRTGSASPPETQLRLALLEAGFPEPDLDFDVYGEYGELLGASELGYRARKIAFEYESDYHRTKPSRWNRDIDKYHLYVEAGWEVIRTTHDLLQRRRAELMRRTRKALERELP